MSGKVKRGKIRKNVDLVFFDKIFRGVWAHMVAEMSVNSVQSIFRLAFHETAVHYPILEHIQIREGGVNLRGLEQHQRDTVSGISESERALWAYLEELARMSGNLSGEMTSRRIIDFVSSQGKGKEFGKLLFRTNLKF